MDPVLSVLVEKLVTVIDNEAHHVIEFPEKFKQIKTGLLFIQSFLNDIDEVNLKDRKKVLKRVMQTLRELIYDAEDIIADCELMFAQQQRRKASKCVIGFSIHILKFRYRMGKKLGKLNQEIEDLKEDIKSFLSPTLVLPKQEHGVRGSLQIKYPTLINETEIVGQDNDFKKIIGWVFKANSPLTVIGIVGMGGIGKTTLAQKICDNGSVKNHFDCIFFIAVSQNFELEGIIKSILRKLKVNEDSLKVDTYGLLKELRCQLNEKHYLLILDDVWGTNAGVGSWWASLKSALSQGSDGNCVIVTTRHEEVVRSMGTIESHIHHPQILSNEDSWTLFSKHAFAGEDGRCPNAYLEDIGKEIVSQCGGLPLAINVMGGMMSKKGYSIHEWRRVSEDLKEKFRIPEKDEKVIPILQMSFEELPMHLKPCILYTCMFPEDSLISTDDMICWWIGEDFVQGRDGRTAYEVGEEWFDELRSRCLLIGINTDGFQTKFISYRVHDLIREMLIKIAREENFIGLDDRGGLSFGTQSRRAGMLKVKNSGVLNDVKSKVLRTLHVRELEESKQFVENLSRKLCQLKKLRVLDISFLNSLHSYSGIDEFRLSGIGSLSHLVHLSIKGCSLLTHSNRISNLHNLKVLRLCCAGLKLLPKEIGSLVKLTILDLTGCWDLKVLPIEVGSLSNLEELRGYVPVPSRKLEFDFCTSQLKKLTKLIKLGIRFNRDFQLKELDLHLLSEIKQLKVLRMDYFNLERLDIDFPNVLLSQMDFDFSPLEQLEELHVIEFPGTRKLAWINPINFPNLRFLLISGDYISRFSIDDFCGKREESEAWKLEVISLNGRIEDRRMKS